MAKLSTRKGCATKAVGFGGGTCQNRKPAKVNAEDTESNYHRHYLSVEANSTPDLGGYKSEKVSLV